MTDQQAANLKTARRIIASRLGLLGDYGDVLTTQIPYELREDYATQFAALVVSMPDRFDALTVQNARDELSDAPNAPLDSGLSVAEAASIFGAEIVNQAQELNPLSTVNREKTRNVLIGAILLAAAVFSAVWAFRTSPRSNPANQ